ncbi:hypothetical protein [Olleya sp. R77988]|uniref:hypothetical protein n=1 Tax=Olleya sp. R77988 TaxID=3093875 RepID=UPI0037CA009D
MWSSQIVAFIVAIIMWEKYKKSTQRNFLFFLGFVLIIEALGYFVPKFYNVKAYFVYNIYIIVAGYFYLYWLKNINKTKALGLLSITIFSVALFYFIIFEDFFKLWKALFILLSILIAIHSFLFYSKLLSQNEVVKYQDNQKFWIVTGTLIFFINYVPLTLLQKPLDIPSIYFRIFILVLNLIMYGFYIMSFLCLKEK